MQTLARVHRAPLPPYAADRHMHVLGPFERFPLAPERAYNVPEASLASHERMKAQVGLERTVLVQASGHGADNRAMPVTLAELQRLHKADVRGLRLNLYTFAARHTGEPSALLRTYERLVAPLGWHVQHFCEPATLLALAPAIMRSSIQVVIDHMGLPDAAQGLDQPVFQCVLELCASGRAWAKLAGADRITRSTANLRDALPFIRALAHAAPQRLVWGSDWPNIGFHWRSQVHDDLILLHRELDADELLDVLAEAVPHGTARHAILADNPQALYGFSRSS